MLLSICFLLLIIIYVSILKYTTLRYKFLVLLQNLKLYIKKRKHILLKILVLLNEYIVKFINFITHNFIIKELVDRNKIPVKFIYTLKMLLNMLNT